MKIRALVGFAGSISMFKGEVREYNDKVVLSDLLKARYIEEIKDKAYKEKKVEESQKETEHEDQKEDVEESSKKGVKNEGKRNKSK